MLLVAYIITLIPAFALAGKQDKPVVAKVLVIRKAGPKQQAASDPLFLYLMKLVTAPCSVSG